jgi:hypothetical protein
MVVTFYRGGYWPYRNIQHRAYQLDKRGITITTISGG